MAGVDCSHPVREFRATPDMDKDGTILGWRVIIQTGRYYEIYIPAAPRMAFNSPELRIKVKRLETIKEKWANTPIHQLTIFSPVLETAKPNEQELVIKARQIAIDMGHCSPPLFQRTLKVPYQTAERLINTLEKDHIIAPYNGQKHREVLVAA